MIFELETCCANLESNKITERKKAADCLWNLIENKSVVDTLNASNGRITWNNVTDSLHGLLKKEAEKLQEDEKKKKQQAVSSVNYTKKSYGDLLVFVVRKANLMKPKLSVSKLIGYMFQYFNSPSLKAYFSRSYITVLMQFILSEKKYWGHISSNEWIDLLYYLKSLYRKSVPGVEDVKILECLQLVLEHGPRHSLPSTNLREQFTFVTDAVSHISTLSPRGQQEVTLKLLTGFCMQTAADNRMACCKVGEQLFGNLLCIYQSLTHNNVKELLWNFFLLQVQIHHPKGAVEGSVSAYACSWNEWNKHLRSLSSALCDEVNSKMLTTFKPESTLGSQRSVDMLQKTFATLIVEVFRQVFKENNSNALNGHTTDSSQPPSKKQRVEFGIPAVISNIQDNKEWPWINVLTELLNKYPDMIGAAEFDCLLRTLSAYQAECKYSNVRYHLYCCLAVLVEVQDHIDVTGYNETLNSLWAVILDCTLRAVGLNENEEQTHKLLQKLIMKQKTLNSGQLFRMYMSEVINITKYSLYTLQVACMRFGLSESSTADSDKRKALIKWIINCDGKCTEVYAEMIMAKVLISLTLKQWLKVIENAPGPHSNTPQDLEIIQDLYLVTCFDTDLVLHKADEIINSEHCSEGCSVYLDTFGHLIDALYEFAESVLSFETKPSGAIKNTINIIMLLVNSLTVMIQNHLVYVSDLDDNKLMHTVYSLLQKCCTSLVVLLEKLNERNGYERYGKTIVDVFREMEKLFTMNLHEALILEVRRSISVDVIKAFFGILHGGDKENEETFEESQIEDRSKYYFELRAAALSLLCKFACVPSPKCEFDTQQHALAALADLDFGLEDPLECKLALRFLILIRNCNLGTLPDAVLENVLSSIQKLCQLHYTNHDVAVEVLKTLYCLYPHISLSGNAELQENSVTLLNPFYIRHHNYGPQVSIALVDCMGQLCKLDPSVEWARWQDNEEIPALIPQFLSNDYQEVRLAAIKNLGLLFDNRVDANVRVTSQNHIFDVIHRKCMEVFNVNGNLDETRQVDETVTRTASALHTYAAVAVVSAILRQKSLFAVLQLKHEKQLNLDSTRKVLDLVAKHLDIAGGVVRLLELNLSFIILNWHNHEYDLKDFPFTLLKCTSLMELYTKYMAVTIPILIANDLSILQSICNYSGKSVEQVMEISYPNIIAKCLLISAGEVAGDIVQPSDIDYKDKSFKNLEQLLTYEKMEELMMMKLDEVLAAIFWLCFDPCDVNSKFSIDYVLPRPQNPLFNVAILLKAIGLIENKHLGDVKLIPYCLLNCPRQLQKLLLQMVASIYNSTSTEDKVKAFHQCSIFMDLIITYLETNDALKVYLIRTISYVIINLIRNKYDNYTILNIISCRYFAFFLSKILPVNAGIFQEFLVSFVSILIPIAQCNNAVGEECTKLLNLMVIEHQNVLAEAIVGLDPFPQEAKFSQMQAVYNKAKYNLKVFTLEEEIQHFLTTSTLMGNSGYRTEGLKHLKSHLSCNKTELKELYLKLYDMRGFTEDCQKSVLHRLICDLVKLSLSLNFDESKQAAKCLGELGPADLLTTVLQAEQKYKQEDCKLFVLITGCVVALLSKYIIDVDIKVMQVASEALYFVLKWDQAEAVFGLQTNFGHEELKKEHVAPFISHRKDRSKYTFDSDVKILNYDSVWYPDANTTHEEWIAMLVCVMLESFSDKSYLNFLVPVCKAKVEFAERLFPFLVYMMLNARSVGNANCVQMRRFFEIHWILRLEGNEGYNIATNKASVQCMLDAVQFVRLRSNLKDYKTAACLDLNYLHVARAAQFCTAHFTALLYVELWCQEKLKELRQTLSESRGGSTQMSGGHTPLEVIFHHEEASVRQILQNILRESYKMVGEQDALRICETVGLLDSQPQVEYYEHLQHWDQAALYYDIEVSQGNNACVPKLFGALKNCSFYQLPMKYEHYDEPQFECAWRLSSWNINKSEASKWDSFEKHQYFALKALHDSDLTALNTSVESGRRFVINTLRHASLESSKNLYEPLSQLQSLLELEDSFEAKLSGSLEDVMEKWNAQDQLNRNEFHYIEPIKAQRLVIMKDLVERYPDTPKDAFVQMHLNLAELARKEGQNNVANRALGNLLYIDNITPEIKNKIMMEEARMWWGQDKNTARYILRNLLNKEPSPRIHASALKLGGSWMIQTCSENPQTIISNYFQQSLSIMRSLTKTNADYENIYDTYDVLARFADSQYQRVLDYIKSSVFERKVQNMEKSKETANGIGKCTGKKLTEDEKRAVLVQTRQNKIDDNEINSTYKEKNLYLMLALKYYIWNLQHSDVVNVRIFRILSLWLENRNNTDVGNLLSDNLPALPSYKYIPILPQLIPHVTSSEEDLLGNQISTIIERCISDHPHHTLPFVLALAHSNKDRIFNKSATNTTSNEPRVAGATKLVAKFKKMQLFKQLINRMEKMSIALIELAYVDERKHDNKIPDSCLIRKIENFEDVLVPTDLLAVRKNCDYNNIVGIRNFSRTFTLVGGLNAPKRISCMGTDGRNRWQLVKGRDDLRQDAVMQQVFSIMNGLFTSNKQTAKLLIRTYKVVPLSQRSGILEWVPNSMPLANYLTGENGKPGAHQLYNPDDMIPSKCRTEFAKIAKLEDPKEKLRVYLKICSRFYPVLHKFFEHSFLEPAMWYERRRAYMYSVATSSVCGYILGLGDRHMTNILIDKKTAEVIHIDFGIAFEQGRVLPTPETVPFRLTRDIEAGMGVLGIEGVFRKSCERTLEVLRTNTETIISILEVLLYDPLYSWTITPAEAYIHQNDQSKKGSTTIDFTCEADNVPVNVSAERALLRLRQKLQGTTEGGSTSIEGQVEALIQQARDPMNLCRLYHGWQPYL